jgi:uncharacterized protein YbcI
MPNTDDMPRPAPDQPAEALTGRDWSEGVDFRDRSSMRAAISNAMVGLKKEFYGKGPDRVKTFFNDNYVFCVLEGGLTRNEKTLIDNGEAELVRQYRLRFQAAMSKPTTGAVAQVTGREVINYHSQIVLDPTFTFEIFVLDAPVGTDDETA